jgi:signal transduction histidine kinase
MKQTESGQDVCMDLLDSVIQSLFGISMRLQSALYALEAEPAVVREEIDASLDRMNILIGRIRSERTGLACSGEE